MVIRALDETLAEDAPCRATEDARRLATEDARRLAAGDGRGVPFRASCGGVSRPSAHVSTSGHVHGCRRLSRVSRKLRFGPVLQLLHLMTRTRRRTALLVSEESICT
jgi:hypothetical protein